jgi:hypothetical protein
LKRPFTDGAYRQVASIAEQKIHNRGDEHRIQCRGDGPVTNRMEVGTGIDPRVDKRAIGRLPFIISDFPFTYDRLLTCRRLWAQNELTNEQPA